MILSVATEKQVFTAFYCDEDGNMLQLGEPGCWDEVADLAITFALGTGGYSEQNGIIPFSIREDGPQGTQFHTVDDNL